MLFGSSGSPWLRLPSPKNFKKPFRLLVDCRLWNSDDFQQEVNTPQLSELYISISIKVALNLTPFSLNSLSEICVMKSSWFGEQFIWQLIRKQKSLQIIEACLACSGSQKLDKIDWHKISGVFVATNLFADKILANVFRGFVKRGCFFLGFYRLSSLFGCRRLV